MFYAHQRCTSTIYSRNLPGAAPSESACVLVTKKRERLQEVSCSSRKRHTTSCHAIAPPPLIRLAPDPVAAAAGDAGVDMVPPAPAPAAALAANIPVKLDIHATVCACLASFKFCRSWRRSSVVVYVRTRNTRHEDRGVGGDKIEWVNKKRTKQRGK